MYSIYLYVVPEGVKENGGNADSLGQKFAKTRKKTLPAISRTHCQLYRPDMSMLKTLYICQYLPMPPVVCRCKLALARFLQAFHVIGWLV